MADIYLYEDKDTNYGTSYHTTGDPDGSTLWVGGWGDYYYSYLEWVLTNAPTSEMVSEVLLSLKVQNVAAADNLGTIRRVTSAWTEAGVTSSNVPTENTTTRATLTNPVTVGIGNRDEKSILDLYREWLDGVSPNYGIKIHSGSNANTQHKYYSSDDVQANAPYLKITLVDLAYSRGSAASVPTGYGALATYYSAGEKTQVADDDADRVAASGTGVLIHQFKYRHSNNTDEITIHWNGQAETAPSSKAVKLQIYNFNSASWEDLDTESAEGADTDFDLDGVISADMANYYDANNYVYARVYQNLA